MVATMAHALLGQVAEAPSMSQALVLAPPSIVELAVPVSSRSRVAPLASSRVAFVYGDSSAFPYEVDYVELTSAFVDCTVALMRSHGAIVAASEAAGVVMRRADIEQSRLRAMADEVAHAVATSSNGTSTRVNETAAAIAELSRSRTSAALEASKAERDAKLSTVGAMVREAHRRAAAALAEFLRDHVLPHTEIGVRLEAREDRYDVDAQIAARCGVEAIFEARVPASHMWRKPLRVVDIAERVSVRLPRTVGVFSKRIEGRPTKLGSLFVTRVVAFAERAELTLRRKATGGRGWHFVFAPDGLPVSASPVDDDGVVGDATLVNGEDAARLRSIWRRVVATTADLASDRRAMRFASADATSLEEHDDLESIVRRMVGDVSPVVLEIARRSGAPGELVLRREVAAWRREEVYVTAAELNDRVASLPHPLRDVFGPLGLADPPRSRRAPPPTITSCAEISVADFLPA
jgi:hypothetical protein